VWINRYELEQKKHIATHTDLMNKEASHQELQMQYKNMQTKVDNMERKGVDMQRQIEIKMRKETELISANERLKRELHTSEKL
jgi:hypothetical protein